MPQSRKPRKPYRKPDWTARSQQDAYDTYADNIRAGSVDKDPPAPAHPHVVSAGSPRAPRARGRYLVPVAVGGAAAGGTAYLVHRARRRKAEMAKGLINPVTGEHVVYEKSYLEDEIDAKPSGVLVAKGAKYQAFKEGLGGARNLAPSPRKQGMLIGGGTMYGFDRVTGGHSRRKAGREALRTEGDDKRMQRLYAQLDSAEAKGDTKRFGAIEDKMVSRHRQRVGDQMRRNEYERAKKRYDESALEHTGSRRGGRTPVSSARRVPGLPVQSASFSQGHTWERPGTSHENRLLRVHTRVKAPRDGRLFHLGRRSKMHKSLVVSKSTGYAQSAGSGRRLIGV